MQNESLLLLRLVTIVTAISLLLVGCRFVRNTPGTILLIGETPPRVEIFHYLVGRTRALGYSPDAIDESICSFRVTAHTGANYPTFFSVRIDDDQRIVIEAMGALVRDGGETVHETLRVEMERLVDRLGEELNSLPGASRQESARSEPQVEK